MPHPPKLEKDAALEFLESKLPGGAPLKPCVSHALPPSVSFAPVRSARRPNRGDSFFVPSRENLRNAIAKSSGPVDPRKRNQAATQARVRDQLRSSKKDKEGLASNDIADGPCQAQALRSQAGNAPASIAAAGNKQLGAAGAQASVKPRNLEQSCQIDAAIVENSNVAESKATSSTPNVPGLTPPVGLPKQPALPPPAPWTPPVLPSGSHASTAPFAPNTNLGSLSPTERSSTPMRSISPMQVARDAAPQQTQHQAQSLLQHHHLPKQQGYSMPPRPPVIPPRQTPTPSVAMPSSCSETRLDTTYAAPAAPLASPPAPLTTPAFSAASQTAAIPLARSASLGAFNTAERSSTPMRSGTPMQVARDVAPQQTQLQGKSPVQHHQLPQQQGYPSVPGSHVAAPQRAPALASVAISPPCLEPRSETTSSPTSAAAVTAPALGLPTSDHARVGAAKHSVESQSPPQPHAARQLKSPQQQQLRTAGQCGRCQSPGSPNLYTSPLPQQVPPTVDGSPPPQVSSVTSRGSFRRLPQRGASHARSQENLRAAQQHQLQYSHSSQALFTTSKSGASSERGNRAKQESCSDSTSSSATAPVSTAMRVAQVSSPPQQRTKSFVEQDSPVTVRPPSSCSTSWHFVQSPTLGERSPVSSNNSVLTIQDTDVKDIAQKEKLAQFSPSASSAASLREPQTVQIQPLQFSPSTSSATSLRDTQAVQTHPPQFSPSTSSASSLREPQAVQIQPPQLSPSTSSTSSLREPQAVQIQPQTLHSSPSTSSATSLWEPQAVQMQPALRSEGSVHLEASAAPVQSDSCQHMHQPRSLVQQQAKLRPLEPPAELQPSGQNSRLPTKQEQAAELRTPNSHVAVAQQHSQQHIQAQMSSGLAEAKGGYQHDSQCDVYQFQTRQKTEIEPRALQQDKQQQHEQRAQREAQPRQQHTSVPMLHITPPQPAHSTKDSRHVCLQNSRLPTRKPQPQQRQSQMRQPQQRQPLQRVKLQPQQSKQTRPQQPVDAAKTATNHNAGEALDWWKAFQESRETRDVTSAFLDDGRDVDGSSDDSDEDVEQSSAQRSATHVPMSKPDHAEAQDRAEAPAIECLWHTMREEYVRRTWWNELQRSRGSREFEHVESDKDFAETPQELAKRIVVAESSMDGGQRLGVAIASCLRAVAAEGVEGCPQLVATSAWLATDPAYEEPLPTPSPSEASSDGKVEARRRRWSSARKSASAHWE